MAVSPYAFVSRDFCVCGASLQERPAISKEFAFGQVSFRHCPVCGSYIQSPMLSADSLARWYDSDDYQGGAGKAGLGYLDYASDEMQRRVEATGRYRRDIAPHLAPGARVLEIGCASATLLAEIKTHGHDVLGCDLSTRFAALAESEHGIAVAVSDYLDMVMDPGSLDAVLLFGTVSNLQRLGESLRRIVQDLKPGGILIFNFPAADGLPARLYGQRFWMFTPSVMQFMTRRGASLAVERAGLIVDHIGPDHQAPSLAKLIGHAKLGFLFPLLTALGIGHRPLPAFPVPGIVQVRARRPL